MLVAYFCVTQNIVTSNNIYLWSHCVYGSESGCAAAGCLELRVSPRFQWRCWPELQSHQKAQVREDLSLSSLTCWWWASVPHWLLAGDISSLPCGPLYKAAHNMASEWEPTESEKACRMKLQSFWSHSIICNLVLKVIAHYFCHDPFMGRESQ